MVSEDRGDSQAPDRPDGEVTEQQGPDGPSVEDLALRIDHLISRNKTNANSIENLGNRLDGVVADIEKADRLQTIKMGISGAGTIAALVMAGIAFVGTLTPPERIAISVADQNEILEPTSYLQFLPEGQRRIRLYVQIANQSEAAVTIKEVLATGLFDDSTLRDLMGQRIEPGGLHVIQTDAFRLGEDGTIFYGPSASQMIIETTNDLHFVPVILPKEDFHTALMYAVEQAESDPAKDD